MQTIRICNILAISHIHLDFIVALIDFPARLWLNPYRFLA
jgi:hypothetical protein